MMTYASRKRSSASREASQPSLESMMSFDEEDSQTSVRSTLSRTSSQPAAPKHRKMQRSKSRAKDAGVSQMITDDIEFALDCVSDEHPAAVREQSAYSLLNMCSTQAALSAMRATGYVERICAALATSSTSGLLQQVLVACVYLLCRDDLSNEELAKMIVPGLTSVLQQDKPITDPVITKALSSCTELPPSAGAPTPRTLAVRILAAAASTQHGRTALREANVLPVITQFVVEQAQRAQKLHMWWLRQCLALLEHATFNCPDNQRLVALVFIPAALRLVDACIQLMKKHQVEASDTLLAVLRAMMNVTNGVPEATHAVGAGGIEMLLNVLAADVAQSDAFDARLHTTGVLTNVVELSPHCALSISKMYVRANGTSTPALSFIVDLFVEKSEEAAAKAAQDDDVAGEESAESPVKTDAPAVDTSANDIEQHSSAMETVISAAYIGLLLGYLARTSDDTRMEIRNKLPGHSFEALTKMLSAFLHLHGTAGLLPEASLKSFREVVKALE
eukprot:TRINITY_DN2967_c0_g1_i1.p1 TRINITY_DN2967_c0_g1~~TRINITY_DN2967_c0_g1_i1.p1  ORF type:complete len:506 (+),score=143.59 TRINITY_DN2967_c0_g1_i1:146-1663(+)